MPKMTEVNTRTVHVELTGEELAALLTGSDSSSLMLSRLSYLCAAGHRIYDIVSERPETVFTLTFRDRVKHEPTNTRSSRED